MNMGSTTHTALNRALWLYVARSICLRAVYSASGLPYYAPTRTDIAICLVEPMCLYRLYYANVNYMEPAL